MADEELTKAFSELQVKRMENDQLVAVAEGQKQALQRSIVHAQLTGQEIDSVPDTTPLYQSVGRMFLLASRDQVKETLLAKEKSSKQKISEIEKNIKRWKEALKEQEDTLRELVLHKQNEK